jgi:uncharacterized protein DUF5696
MKRGIPLSVFFSTLLALALSVHPSFAYNPPVDSAGPLKVTIEGPEEVTEIGTELPVKVVLENSGDQELAGTLRLAVIDRWTVEPAGAIPFTVAPKDKASLEFEVAAGLGTYSAHYPIHAYADFEADGKKLTAHPILILETKVPPVARELPALGFEPFAMASNSELALWRVETHRSVVAPNGKEPRTMPVGWQGSEEESHGSTTLVSETLEGAGKSCIAIHPPWAQGNVGTQWIEYPITLPKTKPIRLQFANAMQVTGESDGVTFRVRAAAIDAPEGTLGEVVFERHTAAKTWTEAEADLSAYAGKTIRLQLESHPGPKNNTGWDRSFWAEPLLVAGIVPEPSAFPPKRGESSQALGAITTDGSTYQVRLWPGTRGLLDAVVGFSNGKQRVFFRGFQIKVLGGRIDDTRSPILLEQASKEKCDSGACVRHRFRSRLGSFDLVGHVWVDEGGFKAAFHLENEPKPRPWQACYLEDVAVGPWSREIGQIYGGVGNVIRKPEAFELSYDGHRLASSFIGIDFEGGPSLLQASDVPPLKIKVAPAENYCALHTAHDCTLTLISADNAWDAVKHWRATNGLKAAGGVKKVAGRFVFDLWGGRYGESAEGLRQAFRYGLTDAMVVWHNWQRWGYDYRLPNICPPNPQFGTLEEMQDLVATCKEAGVLFAPHDNYIDFYPDADGFSYEKVIAFSQGGEPVKAWINKGRDARSYRYRADAIDPFLKSNIEWIRENMAPTGFFIDVWSSARPYSYWTSEGEFVPATYTRDKWGELFAWIRDELGDNAPQISESGHDGLIGWLDGAQTNHLRVGEPMPGDLGWCVWDWKCADAERTPWFDAAHHDRFILHGAGYGSRYSGGLDSRMHGMYSDDYLCTEVLTGHPTMVHRPFSRDVVRKYWLTADVMRELALQTIEKVTYADGDLHRQIVEWSGGGKVWVNRGESDWETMATLPQYGFLALIPKTSDVLISAGIIRRDDTIVEFADTGDTLYANGRHVVDQTFPVRLSVDDVRSENGRRFELDLTWEADVPVPAGWVPFLHFCDDSGDILFQASHKPGSFQQETAGRFKVTATGQIPEEIEPDQECELVYGIYNAKSGHRMRLSGPDIGDQRIRVGHLIVQGEGEEVSGVGWKPYVPKADPYLARWNVEGKAVDFGIIKTAGGCRVHQEGESVLVTPLPGERGPAFDVSIAWEAMRLNVPVPSRVEATDEDGKVLSTEPVSVVDGAVTIKCEPGVFSYRLRR